jgi:hypothetical protein
MPTSIIERRLERIERQSPSERITKEEQVAKEEKECRAQSRNIMSISQRVIIQQFPIEALPVLVHPASPLHGGANR